MTKPKLTIAAGIFLMIGGAILGDTTSLTMTPITIGIIGWGLVVFHSEISKL